MLERRETLMRVNVRSDAWLNRQQGNRLGATTQASHNRAMLITVSGCRDARLLRNLA